MLLYNNRWICLLPFARKPDPRRVSKQVSREPPQAWLFGLVRSAPQAERKRRRQANSARRRPEKIRDLLRSALLARFSLVLLPQSSNSGGRSLFTSKGADRREGASFARSSVLFFLFFREAGPEGIKGNGAPRPRPQSSRAFARAPAGGPSGAAPVGTCRAPTGHF